MKKIGPYPKYQFNYSQDDYKYNLEYKKQAKANESHTNACQDFYIEITPTTVQKVTEELSASIIEGIAEEKELIYVRFAETGGHCVNLQNFKLINTLNGKTRQIYLELPKGKKLIKQPKLLQSISQSKLIYSQFHWFERKNGKFVPLQLSFSDALEQFYQASLKNNIHLHEIMWQQHRFVVDLKSNTLENTTTYEINHIQRRNLQKPYQEPHAKKISRGAMKKIVWQYQLQPKSYEWNNYSEENCKELEKAFEGYNSNCKKANTLKVIKNTSKYYIDFDQMIEYNLTTKERRSIRRFMVEE